MDPKSNLDPKSSIQASHESHACLHADMHACHADHATMHAMQPMHHPCRGCRETPTDYKGSASSPLANDARLALLREVRQKIADERGHAWAWARRPANDQHEGMGLRRHDALARRGEGTLRAIPTDLHALVNCGALGPSHHEGQLQRNHNATA